MKKYFKLVPAALALMAMTSCSNDLFTNEAPTAQVPQEGDLVVENETLEWDADKASTRSYLSADLKVRMYTTNDAIKAFDDELNKYDIYAFSWNDPSAETAGVFRRHNTATNLDGEPRWAIYPDVDGQEGHWAYNKETNNTLVTLSSTLQDTYEPDGTYQKSDTKFENPLYKDMLPRWGEVTATEGGSALNTSLKYLTGVLRLQLNGAPDYADMVTVQVKDGDKYLKINGDFTTTLAINDVMQTAEFKAGDAPLPGEDIITINIPQSQDLKDIDAMKTVVFIPLPTTDHSVNIEVNYYKGGSIIANKAETFENKTIKRAKVYGHTTAVNFAIDADNASGISDAIELQDVKEDADLTIKATQDITTYPSDNIIYIPNKKCQSITVDLSDVDIDAANGLIVKYKDVEGEGKYQNPVIIKTGTVSGTTPNITVQLDETPFTLAQGTSVFASNDIDASALTLAGNPAASYSQSNFTLKDNVKTLNVVQGATITTPGITAFSKLTAVNVNEGATVNGAITVNTPGVVATVTGKGNVNGSTITGPITASGDISISEKCDATTGAIESKNGNVSISNVTTTALDYTKTVKAEKGLVAISGNTEVSGAITAKTFSVTEDATTKDVTVSGDATVNIAYEGEAVSGTLLYNDKGKLNLFNGYVNTVDANGKTVGLYHGEEAGFTAIATLSKGSKFSAKNASKWNGKKMNTTLAATYTLEGTNVWTASQLGDQLTNVAGSPLTLKSDIDLDNKNWKGIAPTAADYAIDGDYHTISNINLVNNGANAGFISANASYKTRIDNLSFNAVKTTIPQLPGALSGVGAVIGDAGDDVTLTNVDVKLAAGYFGSMNGNKNVAANNIGGVIGDVAGVATLTGVTVDATNAILAGHHSMGGFIGNAQNIVQINAYGYTDPTSGDYVEKNSSVTGLTKMQVTQLDLGADGNDPEQGKTGYYIGSADLTKTITIEGADDVNPTFTVGGLVDLSKAFRVSGSQMLTYSKGAQSLIGQSGFAAGTGKTKINDKAYGVHVTIDPTTPNNVLYKVTVTTYK